MTSAYAYPLLIKQLLHTPLANAADQQIVYRDQHRYTYREFAARVARLANLLSELGVQPGDTVAVMDWDSHRYLEAYFAIPMMGATLMTVNIRLSNEQIAYTLDHCGAGTLLVNNDFMPVLDAIHSRLPHLKRTIKLGDEPVEGDTDSDYESLMSRAAADRVFDDFDENRCATTFYTTGTTGLPKAVYFSHRQIVLHTLAVASGLASGPERQRLHRGDVYMPLTPMFHVHAWGLPYVATMLGVKQVYPGRYMPERIVELVAREGVTFSHGVPTVLQLVLDAAGGHRFADWKIVCGGAVMPPGLCQQALARGIEIFSGYGMSESCPFLTVSQHGDAQDASTRMKAGWAMPLVELRVVDDLMNDVARDGDALGEVVVRAPWLTQGYRGDPQASQALWQGGYLHTNDIGRVDASGCLRLVDRLKDVIKTGGEWVSSLDLEQFLAAHPGVAEVAVIGVPSDKWGERPLAIVTPRSAFADTLTAEELKRFVGQKAEQGQLPKYAVPDQVRFVAKIDKTSVGKFDKKALRRKFGSTGST